MATIEQIVNRKIAELEKRIQNGGLYYTHAAKHRAGGGDTLTVTGGGSGGAPTTAEYVTLATDATLTSERVLTAGANITITDNGAGNSVVIAGAAAAAQIHSRSYINFGTNVTGTYTI